MNELNILNFDANAKIKHFKKKEVIQKAGDNNSMAYYVKKGLLRSFTIDEKGKEHVFMFASEGWLVSDISSQEFEKSSELFIDCIEDSEVLVFDYKKFQFADLTKEQLKGNMKLMARRISVLQRRVLMLMSDSARKRYENFLLSYPEIPNRVPQHMIASYLGITPQALSTIRREIVLKKK